MGKIKGGLGEASLISDLTKPISFHISEALEPPPVFERRKKVENHVPEKKEDELAGIILKKAASALEERGNIQVVFSIEGKREKILIENGDNGSNDVFSVRSVSGEDGVYTEVPWNDSSFSGTNLNELLDQLAGSFAGIEVMSDETLLNFSSLHDFYEWLEI